jgi:hypothetical protein
MKKAQQREPSGPPHNFIHFLYIENTKYKDKFVENKIPKSILDLLQQI